MLETITKLKPFIGRFIFYAIEVCLIYVQFKTYGYEWKAALLIITISLLSFADGYWRALNKRK